jgi:CBS-domain-containing membrane protein
MDKEFASHWKSYVFQSLLATLSIFVVLLVFTLQHLVIIASIGATTFIVFAMPNSVTAKARNVVGGHLVGLFCGFLCTLIPNFSFSHSAIAYSLIVGLSIFIMVVADVEHPPASGTALGVAVEGYSASLMIAVVTSVIVLSLAHHFLKPFLRDLT